MQARTMAQADAAAAAAALRLIALPVGSAAVKCPCVASLCWPQAFQGHTLPSCACPATPPYAKTRRQGSATSPTRA